MEGPCCFVIQSLGVPKECLLIGPVLLEEKGPPKIPCKTNKVSEMKENGEKSRSKARTQIRSPNGAKNVLSTVYYLLFFL